MLPASRSSPAAFPRPPTRRPCASSPTARCSSPTGRSPRPRSTWAVFWILLDPGSRQYGRGARVGAQGRHLPRCGGRGARASFLPGSGIAVKGESAGGTHAAALAIAARDRGEVPLCLQVLIYPALDDRTGSTTPQPPYIGHYIWTAAANRFAWTSLLGKPAGSPQAPAGSVPARVENLAGLPPAWIGVGSVDLFANEDLEYARRLQQAGVSTELHLVPGGYHGFDLFVPQAPLTVAFTEGWNAALSRAFTARTCELSYRTGVRPVLASCCWMGALRRKSRNLWAWSRWVDLVTMTAPCSMAG
jgi:hypothetical protein